MISTGVDAMRDRGFAGSGLGRQPHPGGGGAPVRWNEFIERAHEGLGRDPMSGHEPGGNSPALKNGWRTPTLPNYAEGTDYVPETGPAMLHEGEAVLPKEVAEMARGGGRASAALGGSKPKSKAKAKPKSDKKAKSGSKKSGSKSGKSNKSKKPHEMHIRRAANGGFIVEHKFKGDGEEPPDSEEHQVGDMDQLKQHMEEHMGDQEPGPGAAPAGAPAGPTEQPPLRGGM